MPTYEYKCPKCGTCFEVSQKMKDRRRAACPKCGTRAERQLSGGHGIVFKGSGFYETDYKRAGERGRRKEGGVEGKKEGGSGSTGASGSSTSSGTTD